MSPASDDIGEMFFFFAFLLLLFLFVSLFPFYSASFAALPSDPPTRWTVGGSVGGWVEQRNTLDFFLFLHLLSFAISP